MTHTEFFLQQIIGAFFWLVLIIPLGIFLWSQVKSGLKQVWPQNAGGGYLHPDQIVANKVFALGENSGVRRIDGLQTLHVTAGLRWASVAVFGLGCAWYYNEMQYYRFELHYMDCLLIGAIAYYVAFVWLFSVQYDQTTLHVRGWSFQTKRYDLNALDSMTETPNGTWKLWFDDGSRVEVLKFITQSVQFRHDMKEHVARNVANPR